MADQGYPSKCRDCEREDATEEDGRCKACGEATDKETGKLDLRTCKHIPQDNYLCPFEAMSDSPYCFWHILEDSRMA